MGGGGNQYRNGNFKPRDGNRREQECYQMLEMSAINYRRNYPLRINFVKACLLLKLAQPSHVTANASSTAFTARFGTVSMWPTQIFFKNCRIIIARDRMHSLRVDQPISLLRFFEAVKSGRKLSKIEGHGVKWKIMGRASGTGRMHCSMAWLNHFKKKTSFDKIESVDYG